MECEFAKGLIYLENKQQPLNKEDNRRLCRLVVSAYFHKCIAHVCPVEGCSTHFMQRASALMPDVRVLWELALPIYPIRVLLSEEYMWKDLDEVEARVLASPRVHDDVKEAVRTKLMQRRWVTGCRRAWIAAVVSE